MKNGVGLQSVYKQALLNDRAFIVLDRASLTVQPNLRANITLFDQSPRQQRHAIAFHKRGSLLQADHSFHGLAP